VSSRLLFEPKIGVRQQVTECAFYVSLTHASSRKARIAPNVFLCPMGGLVRSMLLATEDARRGVWLTLVSDLAQAYFQLLALEVVG
jgi:hypothetical protein